MTITMYGEDWCPDCIRAKAFFDERNVPYTYIDLEAEPDQVARVLERNDDVKRIPVVVFSDDSHLVEPSNDELAAALARTEPEHAEFEPGEPELAEFEVTDHPEANRFELRRNGELVGFADYRAQGTTLTVPHVETLAAHRGQGYGARLMDGLLDIIRADSRTIRPLCPFAAAHIAENPLRHDLVAP